MFVKLDDVFEFGGRQLRARRAPKKGWPCQMCALSEHCSDSTYPGEDFPQCRGMDREDKMSVVFVEVPKTEPRKGGRK